MIVTDKPSFGVKRPARLACRIAKTWKGGE